MNYNKKEIIGNIGKNLTDDLYYDNKINLLNIDSQFRDIIPKNKLSGNNFISNKAILKKDSNIIRFYFDNNLIKKNDKIVIKNIMTRKETISECLYFIQNFEYVLLNIPNHEIGIDFEKYYSPNKIEISEIDYSLNKISNIPINSLLSKHQIHLIENINLPQNFLDEINLEYDELKNNFIAIKLPSSYISQNVFDILPNLVIIKFTEIGGIPIGFFNADYPVSFNQRQGNYLVSNNSKYWIEIKIPYKSYKDVEINQPILIDKIINENEGYPEISNYTIKLKNHLTNVSSIELVSSEIPNSFNNIFDNNNKIYWQNLDDGNHIYSISVKTGNYTLEKLIEEIENKMNLVERETGNIIKPLNIFSIEFNKCNQTIIFNSFQESNLQNAISLTTTIIDERKRNFLEIIHQGNNVDVGDIITISNSTAIGYIPANIINQSHKVISINRTNNSYKVMLPSFDQTELRGSIGADTVGIDVRSAYIADGGGGEEIKIRTKNFSRLLFNYSDTLGSVLGFRDVGKNNAITEFKSSISNNDAYANEDGFNLNIVGNPRNNNIYLNLSRDVKYLFLYLNDYQEIITNTDAPNCFAKILIDKKDGYKLNGNETQFMINTFVSHQVIFNPPIPNLSQLQIKLTYPDGSLVNFGNIDHSFTLKIIETNYKTSNPTNINSNIVNIYRK